VRCAFSRLDYGSLIALARQNDPFFAGSETDWEQARWFADVWKRLGYEGKTRIHLRRLHYHLADAKPEKLNGKPCENRKADWAYLLGWSKAARILGLVSPGAFDDHRNGEPSYVADCTRSTESEPYVGTGREELSWFLPTISLNSSAWRLMIEAPFVGGYEPNDYQDRNYYVEIWIEKSTQDDILLPLCEELGVTFVTSAGFQSITNAVKVLQRVDTIGKPARIFYISDYDRRGDDMPVAVARQIEFWLPKYAPSGDVKLEHLALTDEQVCSYKLPRDESGRVELDALEGRVPGALAGLVREAVEPYLDRTIGERLQKAREEAHSVVDEEWREMMEPHERKLAAIHGRVESVVKKYQKEATALNRRFQADLARFKSPLERLRSEIREDAASFDPNLPERPEPAECEQDEKGWLFDSSREYLDQLDFYKEHQDKRSSDWD